MDEQKVPRRLKRFYRRGQDAPQGGGYANSFSNREEEFGKDYVADSGRSVLGKIPSMDYEDVAIDKKNYDEIQKLEQTSLEEKLALNEIEKFKNEKKRLPTKSETNNIADSLYTQFKNVDTSDFYSGLAPPVQEGTIDKRHRHGKERPQKAERIPPSKRRAREEQAQVPQEISPPTGNIKDLFGEEETNAEKDFNLDLEGKGNDLEEISDIGEDSFDLKDKDEETCPNCKTKTDKILYCPKCGAAYCEKCGTKNGSRVCPKCGTKN